MPTTESKNSQLFYLPKCIAASYTQAGKETARQPDVM